MKFIKGGSLEQKKIKEDVTIKLVYKTERKKEK